MNLYLRPVPMRGGRAVRDACAQGRALPLGGGSGAFSEVDCIERTRDGRGRWTRKPISALTGSEAEGWLARISAPRPPFAGVSLERPVLMGVVNVTPDSFSDGGLYEGGEAAAAQAQRLAAEGAAIVDFGGESTRPGAQEVPAEIESARLLPAVGQYLRNPGGAVVSVDTRKAAVARAALDAGARIVNDVSALGHDPEMLPTVAATDASVCLMHAQGEPATMQDAPRYADVLLDVYDWLEACVERAVRVGIERSRIAVDPGIGFGKTQAHNLALLQGLSLLLGLGCAVLVGASRKGFIGRLSGVEDAGARVSGSVAVALHAAGEGIHLLRVHDVTETAQALAIWSPLALPEAA